MTSTWNDQVRVVPKDKLCLRAWFAYVHDVDFEKWKLCIMPLLFFPEFSQHLKGLMRSCSSHIVCIGM